MTTSPLHDVTVVLTGRFTTGTEAFTLELEAHGARVRRHISSSTDFLITGTRFGHHKPQQASQLGINLLTEAEARAVMRGDSIKTDRVGRLGQTHIDALIGQARGVLAAPMSPPTWEAVVALLDQCSPEHHEPLSEYLSAHLSRWDTPEAHALTRAHFARATSDPGTTPSLRRAVHLYLGNPTGELRVAPEHWMGELMHQVKSPKYRLIRALDLRGTRASGAKIDALLTHPELSELRQVFLDMSSGLSRDRAKMLFTHENFAHVKIFSPGHLSNHALPFLKSTDARLRPHTLLADNLSQNEEIAVAMAHAPCLQEVKHLGFSHGTPSAQQNMLRLFTELLAHDELMPELDTLMMNCFGPNLDDFHAVSPMFERVHTLSFRILPFMKEPRSGWALLLRETLPRTIEALDLSNLFYAHPRTTYGGFSSLIFASDEVMARAINALCESTLLQHIKRVHLNLLHHDARIVEVFAQQRPDITLLD